MPTEVLMPQMGESITEGTLTKWLKKPGDTIARDEPLFEISTDKVDAEIPSPVAGTLGEIKVEEGATVGVNTVVCTVSDGATSTAPAPAASAPAAQPETAAQGTLQRDTVTPSAESSYIEDSKDYGMTSNSSASNGNGDGSTSAAPAPPTAGPGTDILMPQMGESITEGTLTKWLKKVGDTVQRDEPIFEISTDKVDAEIPSPVAGTLTEIKVQEGATVSVNSIVAIIGAAGSSSAPPASAPVPAPAAKAEPAPAPTSATQEPQRSSPLVRKIATENNVDLAGISGTGASGRITKQDILGHLEGGAKAATPAAAPQTATAQPKVEFQNQTSRLRRRPRTRPPTPPISRLNPPPPPPNPPRPPRHPHPSPANSFPCPRCVPSLRAAWSSPSRPAPTSTPSSRWT